jgi:hypothetical protein
MARRPASDRERPDREEDAQLSVVLPASIVKAVKVRAAERGETLRQTVLRALLADGFKIPAREVVDRRADANKKRGRLWKRPDRA